MEGAEMLVNIFLESIFWLVAGPISDIRNVRWMQRLYMGGCTRVSDHDPHQYLFFPPARSWIAMNDLGA